MTTTNSGVDTIETNMLEGETDAAAQFLARLMPPKDGDTDAAKPSEKTGDTTTETTETTETGSTDETSDASPEGGSSDEGTEKTEQPAKVYIDNDDGIVKVKVGDQEFEAPVKDLKRLYGQEAALTRKGQELATQRQAVEQQHQLHAAALDRMAADAKAAADEFRQIDFLKLARDPNVTEPMLEMIRAEAQKAFEKEAYFSGELNNFVQGVQKEAQTTLATRATEAVKINRDPTSPFYIEGWNQQMYNDMRKFAVDNGLPNEIVNQLVDAPVFKLLHMAMLYSKGSTNTVVTQATNKTPKKIVKSSNRAPSAGEQKPADQKKAMDRLKRSGNTDAAANAFLSRWEDVTVE